MGVALWIATLIPQSAAGAQGATQDAAPKTVAESGGSEAGAPGMAQTLEAYAGQQVSSIELAGQPDLTMRS